MFLRKLKHKKYLILVFLLYIALLEFFISYFHTEENEESVHGKINNLERVPLAKTAQHLNINSNEYRKNVENIKPRLDQDLLNRTQLDRNLKTKLQDSDALHQRQEIEDDVDRIDHKPQGMENRKYIKNETVKKEYKKQHPQVVHNKVTEHPTERNVHQETAKKEHLNDQKHIQEKEDGGNEGNGKMFIQNPLEKAVVGTKYPQAVYGPVPNNNPGEMGQPIIINETKLSNEQRLVYKQGWKNNSYNQYASDMMSLHRSLPDYREPECRLLQYPRDLPDASVIVIFHNEGWSVLLRTVYSIIDRTPEHLLREVILVDDFSNRAHLHKPLDDYIEEFLPKVQLVRNTRREGLIRARLRGAAVAQGAVLVFLDSHCECTQGWIEPLLSRIAENRSNVVTPNIDAIDDGTLKFMASPEKHMQVGGFNWGLVFNWHFPPERERKLRKSITEPLISPTMAGGLFAISKSYFEYLGTYDPGMDIWGGENLELSFRIWMCGGRLEVMPCSHVGHIFRKSSPYTWGDGTVDIFKKNTVRLAEVWLDEYKKYYYERINNNLGDYGDISSRVALRKRLNCKSFKWYLGTIFPELFVPGDALASGEIRSGAFSQCLDASIEGKELGKGLKLWPCHSQGGNQFWMLSLKGEIRRDEVCLDYSNGKIITYTCHGQQGNQHWAYSPDNSLKHVSTELCLEISEDGSSYRMTKCSASPRQMWIWKRKT